MFGLLVVTAVTTVLLLLAIVFWRRRRHPVNANIFNDNAQQNPGETPAMAPEMMHPSAAYAHPYETAESVFGRGMSAAGLIGRVRTFSWRGSFERLVRLAAIVANEPNGVFSERVRRLTVDPIAQLTGDASASEFLARGQAAVAQRRNQIVLAHEEVISFLEHLVILEGR